MCFSNRPVFLVRRPLPAKVGSPSHQANRSPALPSRAHSSHSPCIFIRSHIYWPIPLCVRLHGPRADQSDDLPRSPVTSPPRSKPGKLSWGLSGPPLRTGSKSGLAASSYTVRAASWFVYPSLYGSRRCSLSSARCRPSLKVYIRPPTALIVVVRRLPGADRRFGL